MRISSVLIVLALAGGLCGNVQPGLAAAPVAARADFDVAVDGKDTNPGTESAPFATLTKARDAVRGKIAAGLDRNVVIEVRGGAYPLREPLVFGPDDSGTAQYSITVEVIWLNNNDGTRKRVGRLNAADNAFTLPPPHMWPHGFPGEYNISFPATALSCYFENALEMLDQPGEWYLDRATGLLSYWPREGEDLTQAEVIAPVVQNTLLAIRGTPERPVRNVHFQDLQVAHVDWSLPPYGFAAMFCCLQLVEQQTPPSSWKFGWIEAAVSFSYRFEKNVVYRTDHPLFFCQCSEAGNTWQDNVFLGDKEPPAEVLQAIQAPR